MLYTPDNLDITSFYPSRKAISPSYSLARHCSRELLCYKRMSLCSPFLCSQLRLGKGAFRPDLTFNRPHKYSCQQRRIVLRSTVEASQLTRKENTRKRHQAQRRKGQDGTLERPRLAVYRSNNHIYAQVIDDTAGHTLAAVSSLTPTVRESLKAKLGANKEAAELVGRKIAELCLSKNIDQVFLDRGGLQYHGRIQALAEAAREGGLLF